MGGPHGSALVQLGDPLPLVLLVAGLGSALVIALALAATARRRSLSYLLVTLALATLLTRTLVGVLVVNGVLAAGFHHVLEHGLDVVTVVLLFGAIYAARSIDARPDYERGTMPEYEQGTEADHE